MAFESLSEKLQNVFKNLRSKGRLTEEDVHTACKDVKMALLEADVNFKVVKNFIKTVEETKVAIRELQPVLSEWIVIMDKVDNELTHDGSRHSIERAASFMLMKWASIVTDE